MSRIPVVFTLSGRFDDVIELYDAIWPICERFGLQLVLDGEPGRTLVLFCWSSTSLTDEHLSSPEPSRSPRRSQRKKPIKQVP